MKYYYKVAEHTFYVELPDNCPVLDEMGQYAPFTTDESDHAIFSLHVVDKENFPQTDDVTTEMNQDDDGSQILAGRAGDKPYFEFQLWGRCAARMVTNEQYNYFTLPWLVVPDLAICFWARAAQARAPIPAYGSNISMVQNSLTTTTP